MAFSQEPVQQAQALLQGFWTAERLQALLDALLFCYMPLSVRIAPHWENHIGRTTSEKPHWEDHNGSTPQPKELSEWAHNPEELYHELESAPEDTDRLRPAAERLWLHVARHHTAAVVGCLGRRLPEVLAGAPPGALPGQGGSAVERKAAVYDGVGLAAGELYDHLHGFDELLRGTLISDMECAAPATRPVQRQAIKLVARWCSKLAPLDRPPLYALLVKAMHGDDVVIALTAARSLHTLVDDWYEAMPHRRQTSIVLCSGALRSSTSYHCSPPCLQRWRRALPRRPSSTASRCCSAWSTLSLTAWARRWRPTPPGSWRCCPPCGNRQRGRSCSGCRCWSPWRGCATPWDRSRRRPTRCCCPCCSTPWRTRKEGRPCSSKMRWLRGWWRCATHPVAPTHCWRPCLCCRRSCSSRPVCRDVSFFSHNAPTEYLPGCCAVLRSALHLGGGPLMQHSGAHVADVCMQLLGNVTERGMTLLLGVLSLAVQVCAGAQEAGALLPAFQRLLRCLIGGGEGDLAVVAGVGALARLLLAFPTMFVAVFDAAGGAW